MDQRFFTLWTHATATAMVDLMEDDDCPFNTAQELRVQDVVMGLIERAAAASAAGAATKQENRHRHNYLTAPLRACIQSDDTVRNKLRQCARHCVDILNMPNPDELTCRDIVATVLLASGSKDAASVTYKFVREFGDMMESMRQMGDTTNAPGLRIVPADSNQFAQMYPSAYPEGQPPVECKLDIRDLKLKKDEARIRQAAAADRQAGSIWRSHFRGLRSAPCPRVPPGDELIDQRSGHSRLRIVAPRRRSMRAGRRAHGQPPTNRRKRSHPPAASCADRRWH